MNYSKRLKQRIKENIKNLIIESPLIIGKEKESAFIFDNIDDNFNPDSYQKILSNPQWEKRLRKKHPDLPDTLEMQSSNSSDAILMNIFCNPKLINWTGIKKLFNITDFDDFLFGWKPDFSNEKLVSTEIDLKFNDIIIEAKLTEDDFQSQDPEIVEAYDNFSLVFDCTLLELNKIGKYKNYQLIRNILAAYKYKCRFILLVDESRIDLIKEFIKTTNSIKDNSLRNRMEFITWQEITNSVGKTLSEYIQKKYF